MNLSELKKIAEAATPGPWRWLYDHGLMADHGSRRMILTVGSFNRTPMLKTCNKEGLLERLDPSKPDPLFMEKFNPTTALKLIAAIEKMRVALKFYSDGDHYAWCGGKDDDEPESPSGEPANWLSGDGPHSYEDGSIAGLTLAEVDAILGSKG